MQNDADIILNWAESAGLTAHYLQVRPVLFGGVHPGLLASLAVYMRPLDQLWSDVQALERLGALADGEHPYRKWLANLTIWAQRSLKPVEPLGPVLARQGLTAPVSGAASAPMALTAPVKAEAPESVRVLFISANLDRKRLLNIDRELNEIHTLVDSTDGRDRFDLTAMPNIELTQVARHLQRQRPHVLHFSGHGGPDGALQMRGPGETPINIRPEGLAGLLAVLGGSLKLVVLNACYTDTLAQKIIEQMDVVVLGMTHAVLDPTALQYARGLYQTLFGGATIRASHLAAQAMLVGYGQVDADVPKMRVRDGSSLPDQVL
jgi:hypothetical protein